MSTSQPEKPRIRQRLVLATLIAALAGGLILWNRPAPLTAEEQKLVGVWTFPVGPNPPANALRQFFELRADHTLRSWNQRIDNGAAREPTTGKWRLEGDTLVFEHSTRDYWAKVARSFDGGRRPERTSISRMPYLGAEPDRFRVEDSEGGEILFERAMPSNAGQ